MVSVVGVGTAIIKLGSFGPVIQLEAAVTPDVMGQVTLEEEHELKPVSCMESLLDLGLVDREEEVGGEAETGERGRVEEKRYMMEEIKGEILQVHRLGLWRELTRLNLTHLKLLIHMGGRWLIWHQCFRASSSDCCGSGITAIVLVLSALAGACRHLRTKEGNANPHLC
jgi:hypothetical protein